MGAIFALKHREFHGERCSGGLAHTHLACFLSARRNIISARNEKILLRRSLQQASGQVAVDRGSDSRSSSALVWTEAWCVIV